MSNPNIHINNAIEIVRKAIQKSNPDKSNNEFNKNTTISMADDDDGLRVEHEMFSVENALYSDEWGNDNVHASVDVLGYEVNGGAFGEFGVDEVEVGAYVSASAHVVRGEAGIEAGPVNGGVEGSIGAQASAEANLEVDLSDGTLQVETGLDAFAGGEIGASAGVDVGVAGVEGGFEGKAGVGAEFEADVGFEDGEFNASFELGAALGLGGGFDVEVSVDVGGMASGAVDAAGKVGGWLNPFG